jgi:hypothetical protein
MSECHCTVASFATDCKISSASHPPQVAESQRPSPSVSASLLFQEPMNLREDGVDSADKSGKHMLNRLADQRDHRALDSAAQVFRNGQTWRREPKKQESARFASLPHLRNPEPP